MNNLSLLLHRYPVLFLAALPLWISTIHKLFQWMTDHDQENALCTLVLTILLWGQLFWKLLHYPRETGGRRSRLTGWVLLFSGILILIHPHLIYSRPLTAFILLIAAVIFFYGIPFGRHCLIPFLWCSLYIERQEELLLLLSSPFRRIATCLAAFVLQLLNQPVINTGTNLLLGEHCLAITYTCSGIQQLDIFMILALLHVQRIHSQKSWQYLHFFFFIPCIILANTVRLILIILLYNLFGKTVLLGLPHVMLGYFQLVLALLLFYLLGKVLQAPSHPVSEEVQQ